MSEETASVVGTDERAAASGAPTDVDTNGPVGDDGAADEEAPDQQAPDEQASGRASSDRGRTTELEREGDIAADYLEEFLDIVDADGDIDLAVESDRAMVAVVGADLEHLVGDDGAVLDALQELTRLAVYSETEERSRLMLDISGFRARRRDELARLAEKVVAEVRAQQEAVRMDPMSPFERKVVHDVVAAAGLGSESEGVEPERRVVVHPE